MPNLATLILDIGSVTTRATLTDTVAGQARLVGQAEIASTYEPPYNDVTVSLLQAAAAIHELTGRQLLDGDQLLTPRTSEGDGVDQVIAVTSAAGPMALVVAAVSSDISARSALHASRAINSTVLQTITLNDATEHSAATGDYSWIERQVQRLIGLNPDAILLAGGLEDGAQDSLVRLAHIIGLAALSSRVGEDGQARQDVAVRPVIYAGNSQASERVIESLSNKAEPIVVENVRPSLEQPDLEPMRRALTKLYSERILGQMPGFGTLKRMSATPIRTTTEAASLIVRFLAELYGRNVLAIDVGSASTSALLFSQGSSSMVVLGATGSGYGAGHVLAERGPAALMRWLPFPMHEQALTHAVLNKQIRPNLVPTSAEDAQIEYALVREAIALAGAALFDERPNAPFDFVLASGGVLAHALHPAYALLAVLDGLQPMAEGRAVEIYLDSLSLVNVAGALAYADAESAFSLIEQDLLRNTALATCVVAQGTGRAGDRAVEARLRIVGGEERSVVVGHGQIGRIELAPGQTAQLLLKPASGVRIAGNPPGASIETGAADIHGSTLGVVIDARGRPLRLPESSIERQQALWDWLTTLGAESGPLPYEAAAPLAPVADLTPTVLAPVNEEVPLEAMPASQPTTSVPGLDGDLAKLRQTVEQPKKRGLFGRK